MTYVARDHAGSWAPGSWRAYEALHQPFYPDQEALAVTLGEMQSLPPLVSAAEVTELRNLLAEAANGRAHVLQAGDCAESFSYCHADRIDRQASLIAHMADLIAARTNRPVVRIGRIAGQYAKPRSAPMEVVRGEGVWSFLGENVNDPSPARRTPDPRRLMQGYLHAAKTANHLRSDGQNLFLSHEALILPLEEAMTRYDPATGSWYNGSAHMVWIGERTRGLQQAHAEYARGILNPIGIKIGPTAEASELLGLIRLLNPSNAVGKIVLITRLGGEADPVLRRLIAAIRADGATVLWLSDPMHGNTTLSAQGIKTRYVSAIIREVEASARVHKEAGSAVHGLHLEVAAEEVTECIGGSICADAAQLTQNYQSLCDPRLNPEQAVAVSAAFAEALGRGTGKGIGIANTAVSERGYHAEQ